MNNDERLAAERVAVIFDHFKNAAPCTSCEVAAMLTLATAQYMANPMFRCAQSPMAPLAAVDVPLMQSR